jgi:cytochrome c-type biogenesis protein CcmF
MERSLRRLLWPFAIALAFLPVMVLAGVRHPAYLTLLGVATFATVSNAWTVVVIMRKNWSAAGGYLAHVGIGLAIVGIVTSTAFSTKQTVVLPKGEEVMALGYGFKYLGQRPVEDGRKDAYDVALRTADGAHILSPTMFFSDFNAGMMKKPAIQMFLARDVYVSPIGAAVDPLDERVLTRFEIHKGMPVPALGMTFDFRGIRMESVIMEGHDHPVDEASAEIVVTRGDRVDTVWPALRADKEGHTEVDPAMIPDSDQAVTLLAVDLAGTRAQLGVRRPAVGLSRGETAAIEGFRVTMNGFDVEQAKRQGGTVRVFANAHVEVAGESFHVRPGLVQRPGTEELEMVEAPIGRTGMNLILDRIESGTGRAFFHVTATPQEYLYAELSLKPFIVLLWIGTALTVTGLVLATINRARMAGRMKAAGQGEERAEIKKNGSRVAA